MRKGLIIFIIVVLAAGSLAGVVYYRKSTQKDSQLADQLDRIEALKKKISKLDQDIAGFRQQSVSNQKRINSLEDGKQHVVQLESLLKEKDEALAAAKNTSDALKVSTRDLEAKLRDEQASLQSQGEELQTAHARIETLTTDLDNTTRSRDDLETQVATLKRELAQTHDNITREQIESQNRQKTLEAAQSRIIDMQQEIEQNEKEKNDLEKTVSGLNTQIRSMRKDRYESRLALQNKQKELEVARSEFLNLQQEIQKNEAVKAALDDKVSGLTAEAFDLKDAHHRILKLQKEIQQTTKLNLSLKNLVSILRIQLNDYKEKTLRFENTIEEKETQLEQIVSNLNNCLIGSKDVEGSLQRAQSQIISLTGMVEQARVKQVVLSKQLSNLETEKAEMAVKLTEVKQTYDTLLRELHDKIEANEAVIKDCEKKFSVTFVDRVLFHSGKASIVAEGKDILKKTGDILSKMRYGVIRIAGHTDNIPIRRAWRGRYPTNWELSAARAAAVARLFQKVSHISPEKIEIIGFGEHQPIASNMTREGRARNRRVEITISPIGPKVRTLP